MTFFPHCGKNSPKLVNFSRDLMIRYSLSAEVFLDLYYRD